MSEMANYIRQQQAWADEQQQNMARLQSLDVSRNRGLVQAKTEEASRREIMKVRMRTEWEGLKILAVVSLFILLFLYNNVLASNRRIFWGLTVCLTLALVYKFAEVIREDGPAAIGHLTQ